MINLENKLTSKDTYSQITINSVLNKQKIEKYLSIYICKLCNNIPLKPMKDVLGCGCYFCQGCLDKFWKREQDLQQLIKSCPNNCNPFHFKEISGIELHQFKEILIKCKNYENGCKMIYNYDFFDLLIEHEKECEFKINLNTSKEMKNKSISKFNSANSPMKLILCDFFNQYCGRVSKIIQRIRTNMIV